MFVKVYLWKKIVSGLMAVVFAVGSVGTSYAQGVSITAPGTMVSLSESFAPPLLKGVKVYPDNPFRLDFILDKGSSNDSAESLKTESARLIKYFLASITVPEKDLWVNLSPYEKDRIVPDAFGVTEMGRDLLAQDYMLKQITASVIYPEGEVGKAFWAKVYAEAQKRYGTSDVPVDTFNKVWIVPEKAVVYETKDSAYVVESKLKVMLEEDYLALEKNSAAKEQGTPATNKLGSDIVREVVIPVLEKEINEGRNFTQLRQVYQSLILAIWYKDKIKESLLGKSYVDKEKTGGVDIADKGAKDKIWAQYVVAFKKGAYNYIKEDYDSATQQVVPRKYFSGGANFGAKIRGAIQRTQVRSLLPSDGSDSAMIVQVDMAMSNGRVAKTVQGIGPYTRVVENQQLERFRKEAGMEVEIVSGVPVFTVDVGRKEDVAKIADLFGRGAVFRIINALFVGDAIEFGTDKGRVEQYDFRRIADGAGYDVWGVEKKAKAMGLNKTDVFCGTPYDYFVKGKDEYSSRGLGIPEDRSAVLIFDANKLREIEDTDGYAFTDPANKREALWGVVKFRELPTEFERELDGLKSVDDKVSLLEKEVFQNLNTKEDLKQAPYLALAVIALLYRESLESAKIPSDVRTQRINQLNRIADRLVYETQMIDIVDNMAGQVGMTREAFGKDDPRKMAMMRTWPDFVIETTQGYLMELELDEKYKQALVDVIKDAEKCKQELGIGDKAQSGTSLSKVG